MLHNSKLSKDAFRINIYLSNFKINEYYSKALFAHDLNIFAVSTVAVNIYISSFVSRDNFVFVIAIHLATINYVVCIFI